MSDWGGARTPANPAVVSGPGSHSARTDGGVMNPNSPSYGEGAELEALKSAAPMAGPSGAQGGGSVPPGPDFSQVVPLGAPSQAQGPVTAGAAAGAGPGPEALGLPLNEGDERRADARSLPPGLLNALIAQASQPDATPSFRRRVREVLVNL